MILWMCCYRLQLHTALVSEGSWRQLGRACA